MPRKKIIEYYSSSDDDSSSSSSSSSEEELLSSSEESEEEEVVSEEEEKPKKKKKYTAKKKATPKKNKGKEEVKEDVKSDDAIYFFDSIGKYGAFSNRSKNGFKLDDKRWQTVEHYYQAMKFKGTDHEEVIRKAKNATIAAKLGKDKSKSLRKDWEEVKEYVMEEAIRAKFEQSEALAKMLIQTGSKALRFGKPTKDKLTDGDTFWGYASGNGKNNIGLILTKVRAELKQSGNYDDVAEEDDADENVDKVHSVEYAPANRASWYVSLYLV